MGHRACGERRRRCSPAVPSRAEYEERPLLVPRSRRGIGASPPSWVAASAPVSCAAWDNPSPAARDDTSRSRPTPPSSLSRSACQFVLSLGEFQSSALRIGGRRPTHTPGGVARLHARILQESQGSGGVAPGLLGTAVANAGRFVAPCAGRNTCQRKARRGACVCVIACDEARVSPS
jgi:hypothetical protein